jgi:hypothetical protein
MHHVVICELCNELKVKTIISMIIGYVSHTLFQNLLCFFHLFGDGKLKIIWLWNIVVQKSFFKNLDANWDAQL